ncbi:phosphatidylinositol N-acetylglucosaminyltransferase subunit H isoform X2 [Dromaius novaehollandiae]|uniref:phosphatidylinositol N-acetylglucosaminyltransferase subunit H isoform X2 n=1 Tax=Dromaius novaehollandiae TaxID=8790 RepID=UPI000E1F921C|nr:phosphatidylinositol N-acetylglucosaminyltransferase subunit H isoform X2 [Dromaius novaehollandiae]XP_025951626.1 phosphatidylinositol N-acetylglucosaminyltransferase subunit H isoform X2 [Dromaius novaehollandiae]XP_025951627.1 phosphatidylinositol N-acetylglucosaminyltransferase subunit H isoform X2 [Dromaius novaehollandiae]
MLSSLMFLAVWIEFPALNLEVDEVLLLISVSAPSSFRSYNGDLCLNCMVLSAAIFITLIGLIVYLHFVKIDQESLLVIGSLGIQVTSSYASGKESTTFIEMSQVKDVVINEAIHMQKVIYYLCILLQDPQDPQGVSEVVPLFQLNSEQCYFHGNILILVNSTPPAKEVQKELCQFEIHYLPVILTFQVRVSMLLSFEGAVISNSVATHSLGLCSSKLCQSSKIPFIVSLSPGTLLR